MPAAASDVIMVPDINKFLFASLLYVHVNVDFKFVNPTQAGVLEASMCY